MKPTTPNILSNLTVLSCNSGSYPARRERTLGCCERPRLGRRDRSPRRSGRVSQAARGPSTPCGPSTGFGCEIAESHVASPGDFGVQPDSDRPRSDLPIPVRPEHPNQV